MSNQLGRRNLDALTRVELARRMAEAMLRAKAKANKIASGGDRGNQYTGGKVAVLPKCANPIDPVHTREGIAAIAGVGTATMWGFKLAAKVESDRKAAQDAADAADPPSVYSGSPQ